MPSPGAAPRPALHMEASVQVKFGKKDPRVTGCFFFFLNVCVLQETDTSPPQRTLRRRPASAGEGYCASLPTSIVQSHGGVCGWGPGRGSGAGRTGPRGGSTSLGGRVESICTSRVRLVWGISPRDGGRGRRGEGRRGVAKYSGAKIHDHPAMSSHPEGPCAPPPSPAQDPTRTPHHATWTMLAGRLAR